MIKKFKMTPASLKKAGKELEEILVPTDDKGNPLKIAVKDQDEMKAKIIEGGNELTIEDEISANLTSVLAELGVSIGGGEETVEKGEEKDSGMEELEELNEASLTWEDINSMNKKELIEVCEKMDLVTDSGDYDELKDFRTDVAIELEFLFPEEDTKEEVKEETKEIETTDKDNESNIEKEEEVDLGVLVSGTKKLAHLKEICEIHDDFKKLRKGLKKYKGLSGPRELKPKMLKLLGIEPKEVKIAPKPKVESEPKPEKKKETIKKYKKVEETKKETVQKSTKKKSRYGRLINSMVGIIDGLIFDGVTEDKVVKEIQNKYPGKEEDKIIGRFHVHINQLKKEGITINKKGKTYTSEEETHPNVKNMFGKKK